MSTAEERRAELKRVYSAAAACSRCPVLAEERSTVVFGAGHPDADLMLVAAAPGRQEDEQGLPVAGASGRLLSELLESIGLDRSRVYVTTAVKCRPPGNRDPLPAEVANCRNYLERQVALVRPKVVATLGNFATRLLRDDPAGVTRVHGEVEVVTIGGVAVRLLPLFHPAAALYAPTLSGTLRADVARLPGLLALPAPGADAAEPAEAGPHEPGEAVTSGSDRAAGGESDGGPDRGGVRASDGGPERAGAGEASDVPERADAGEASDAPDRADVGDPGGAPDRADPGESTGAPGRTDARESGGAGASEADAPSAAEAGSDDEPPADEGPGGQLGLF